MNSAENPLVSVVIPAFNAAAYIQDAVETVLAQSYRPLEIIIVDDGSTDDTVERVARYADQVVLLRQSNRGPGAARNLGVSRATGQIIAFLDADDLWPAERLKNMVELMLRHPEAGIVRGQIQRMDGLTVREAAVGQENLGPFSPVSAIYRASIFALCGGFDQHSTLRGAEDLDWYLRCQERGVTTVTYAAPSIIYRRTNGLSANVDVINTGLLSAVKKKLERERALKAASAPKPNDL